MRHKKRGGIELYNSGYTRHMRMCVRVLTWAKKLHMSSSWLETVSPFISTSRWDLTNPMKSTGTTRPWWNNCATNRREGHERGQRRGETEMRCDTVMSVQWLI